MAIRRDWRGAEQRCLRCGTSLAEGEIVEQRNVEVATGKYGDSRTFQRTVYRCGGCHSQQTRQAPVKPQKPGKAAGTQA